MKKKSIFVKFSGLLVVTALIVSCGTAKKTTKSQSQVIEPIAVQASETQTADYSGNYDWVVVGTPNGDQAGSMSLKKTETGYSGEIVAMGMGVPIEKITTNGNKMSGYLFVQDMELGFTIAFEKEGFKGSIFTSDADFPFNGKKVK